MKIYIFTGPTLNAEECQEELSAIYLPPVSQGDVYRVAQERPFAIGIIDGYFDRIPAVWHKEILWAMSQGIHVFGAASMGALRAAELYEFGMEGVGWVYEAFRDGILEDDDEVAVTHNECYVPLSEAMVNIRCTLRKAEAHGIISSATRTALERLAKATFYPERTYPYLLKAAEEAGVAAQEISSLERWLPTGRWDQKQEDALAMLRAIRGKSENSRESKTINYCFERTHVWRQLTSQAGQLSADAGAGTPVFTNAVIEELKLEGERYTQASERCLVRLLLAYNGNVGSDEDEDYRAVLRTIAEFRQRHNLLTATALREWIAINQLSEDHFMELMYLEGRLYAARRRLAGKVEAFLPGYLRLTDEYQALAARARKKREILQSRGLENPTANDIGMGDRSVVRWYFRRKLRRDPPKDLLSYARHAGFRDEGEFLSVIRRERCYAIHTGRQAKAKRSCAPNSS